MTKLGRQITTVATAALLLLALVYWREPRAGDRGRTSQTGRTSPTGQTSPTAALPPTEPAEHKPQAAEPEPAPASAFSAFNSWAEAYLAAPTPAGKAALLAGGEELAKARRKEMAHLIKSDPQQALELAVSYGVRKQLPASVNALLEEHISGRGDFSVISYTPLPGSGQKPPPDFRRVALNHKTYDAFVYGRRLQQRSQSGISLHGVAIDKLLAVSAEPLRLLSAEETVDAFAARRASPEAVCPLCGQKPASSGKQTLVELGGKITSLCQSSEALLLNQRLAEAESKLPAQIPTRRRKTTGATRAAVATQSLSANASANPAPPAVTANAVMDLPPLGRSPSQGRKRLLLMPVLFFDDPRPPNTIDGTYGVGERNNKFFVEGSYNTASFDTTVTPFIRLPEKKIYYGEFIESILPDALVVAQSLGFDAYSYDFQYVLFTSIAGVSFGGRSDGLLVGSGGSVSHELGHNFGLSHANYWDTRGNRPLPPQPNPALPIDQDSLIGHDDINAPEPDGGAGTNPPDEEYGDIYDVMGSGGGHFSTAAKFALNWLPDPFTRVITRSETNRLYAFDIPNITAGRLYALRITKDYQRVYWASYRQGIAGNPWLASGIELTWATWPGTAGSVQLLDTTPGTSAGKNDAAVVIGRTYADPQSAMYLTPVAKGGAIPTEQWIDVVVQLGPFPTNLPPVMTLSASQLAITNGGTVGFTVTASDPNGDPLAYYWDFGDDTFGTNSPTNIKTFFNTGQFVVRCEVSDMKGGVASAYVVVVVGNPTTFTMSGQITDVYGNPVQGARVHNSGSIPPYVAPDPYNPPPPPTNGTYRYSFTDSQGYYTIGNIPPGSYTNRAFLYGYHIDPIDFYDPVPLNGGNAINLDHLATPLPVVSIATLMDAYEGPTPGLGTYTVSRTGETNTDLDVRFAVSGTAVAGLDYIPLGTVTSNVVIRTNGMEVMTNIVFRTNLLGGVTIPAGSFSADVLVTPIDNNIGTGPKTVVVTLLLQTNDIRISTVLTNVVTTNGGMNVTNSVFVYRTNRVRIPGWETLPTGPNNELVWYQTYPTYILGKAEQPLTIFDDDPPDVPSVSVFATRAFQLSTYPGAKPDSDAIETGNDSAIVTFLRTGGSVESNLVVSYTLSGTASNGVDYQKLSGSITIPAGERYVNLPIVALNDLFVEGNETVSVTITTSALYRVGVGTAQVLIIEDDLPLVSIYSTDSTGLKTGSTATMTVEREGDLSKDLLVNYQTTGSALSGVDYQVLNGSITIPAGQITATITITPINSTNPPPRTVTALLSDSPTYNISALNGRASVTIIDQLPLVTLAVTAGTVGEGGGAGVFTVSRTGPTTSSLVVNFELGGSALEGRDYSAIGRTVTIPAGAASATIQIVPANDLFNEFGDISGNDTVIVQLAAGTGYNLGNTTSGVVTISNDDGSNRPAIGFLLSESSGREDSGLAHLAVRITANPRTNQEPVLIDYRISSGTAANGVNYDFTGTGTVSFAHFMAPPPPPGPGVQVENSIQFIDIPLLDDGVVASNKFFVVTLFTHVGYTTNLTVTTNGGVMVTNAVLIPTVTNAYVGDYISHKFNLIDVGATTVDIQAVTPFAYEEGTQPGAFAITRTGSTNTALTVNFAVSGTASSGSDFVPLGSSVTIPAGTNTVTLYVVPNDDSAEEIPETVIVTLLAGPGFSIGSSQASIIIVDNDGTIQFTAASFSVNEDEGPALITVQRTGNTNLALSVDYLINSGTASNGLDFIASNGRISFAPGEVLQTIPVQIVNDILVESVETVSLVLTNPTGGVPLGGQSTATLFIVDDDTGFAFATNNFRVNENGANAPIVINRLGLTDTDVTVSFWTTSGSATEGVDYRGVTNTLTFVAGENSKTVLVPIFDDGLLETNETVILHLTNSIPGSLMGGSSTGTLTIVDDECVLQFASASYSTNEYAGFVTLVVQRLGGTVNPVSVDFHTVDGTANSTDPVSPDFNAKSGTIYFQGDQYLLATNGSGFLEFHPGDSNQVITIPIFDDVLGEGNETFNVILTNPVGPLPPAASVTATVLGAQTNATVTIIDNETPGSVDYEFNPGIGANDRVLAVALQPDLRIVFGGDFTKVNDINFNRIARLQANGNLDNSFNPGAGIDGTVYVLVSQTDGKVLVGGAFSTINGTNRVRIARLNANGNLDLSFNPGSGANGLVRAIAVQTDNKILIGGDFTQVNGVGHNHLARFNADGSLDATFAPSINNSVNGLAVQTDGKIVAGGAFTSVNGTPRNSIARLNAAGTVDLGFDPGNGANGPVNSVGLQSDGKIVLGGAFTVFDGNARSYIARLTSGGPLDTAFTPGAGPNGPVNSVAVHSGGKIVIGGSFTSFSGASRSRFARLKASGALDLVFNPGTGADAVVQAVAVQPDSAVILGGDFTQINGLVRNHIARVHGDEKAAIISVEFPLPRFTVWETNPVATITVVRSGNTNSGFTIGYATTDGTASNGVDYAGTTNTLTFAGGETNKTFTITIMDDLFVEGDETVNLALTNGPPNVDLSGIASAVLAILDNERFIAFSATNYIVHEGDTNARITLRRTGGLSGTASVTFTTTDGSATAGLDYSNATTTVTFADGETNTTVLIPIIDDFLGETGETILMSLSNPVGATLGTRSNAVLTIIDNDLVYGTFNYNNTNKITILDGGPASPYPSSIAVSNLTGVVAKASVTLLGLTHTFPSDIGVLLVNPSGQKVVLMADAGGSIDVFGATLRFDDSATTYLPQAGPIVTSTNRPTDYPPGDVFANPAPPGPYSTVLSAFNGSNPNGLWSLYVMDNRGSDSGFITNGWRLSLTTIDPVTTNELALGMTASPDPLAAGNILSYTLSVTNNGPIPATGMIVQDTLPSSMSLFFIKFSQGSCSNLGNVVTCNLGDLAAGDVATVIIKVVPTTAGTFTNNASVSANEPDIAPANNAASAVTTVTPAVVADLAVTMTDAPDPVLAGQLLTYLVSVTNNGPLIATGVKLTNALPGGANFFSATTTQGSYVPAGSTLVFDIGTLGVGAGATATIIVQPRTPGSMTNVANAAANEPDSSPDNRATAVTRVDPAADLVVTLVDSLDPVLTNSPITYTATILNNGPVTAHGVSLFDTLPAQLTFISASGSQGSNFLASGTLIFDFGTILSGASATAIINVQAPPTPGIVANQVVVIGAEADPNTANNSAIESTTVTSEHVTGAGIINNGTIQMGVNPAGDLNVPGGALSSGPGINTTYVGLRYIPTRAESTADGCLCEGWGVADTIGKIAGGANESSDGGAFGLVVESFTFDASTARSVVRVLGTNESTAIFRVTHYYHPSVTPNLYQVDVTIDNISTKNVHVLYRRVMDWDIEPTAFNEFSTMNKGTSTNLYFTSDNGFASANPLSGPSQILVTGNFVDSGPADHGALFDFDFGTVSPGGTVFFRTYYGAAGTETDANKAVARVGAEAYSYGQPNTPKGPSRGEPNTFIFAFGGIGGSLLFGADVGLGMTALPNPVALGDPLTYSISITNAGPDPATGVTLTDTLPSGISLLSATTSLGTVSNSTGTVTVALGGMAKGAVAVVTLVVLPNAEALLTNTVSVTANEVDGNIANNLATSVNLVLALGTFANPALITIADASPAIPYPATTHVSGLAGVITKVTATLVDLSHSFPADIDALLVGPGGQNVLLMSDAGQGDDISRVTLKFDDDATNSLPANSPILAGIYKPTNIGGGDLFNPPAPAGPFGAALSVFNGTSANGDWLLYVMDDQGSDAGAIFGGWRLTFTTGAAAPQLRIELSGNTITLSWPASSPGFVLESQDVLSATDVWNQVPGSPSVVAGRYTLNVGLGGGGKFFRLRQ